MFHYVFSILEKNYCSSGVEPFGPTDLTVGTHSTGRSGSSIRLGIIDTLGTYLRLLYSSCSLSTIVGNP